MNCPYNGLWLAGGGSHSGGWQRLRRPAGEGGKDWGEEINKSAAGITRARARHQLPDSRIAGEAGAPAERAALRRGAARAASRGAAARRRAETPPRAAAARRRAARQRRIRLRVWHLRKESAG